MNKYLLAYDKNLGTRQQIVDVLNTMKEVRHWRFDMPNTFYIYSDANHNESLEFPRREERRA